MKLVKKFANIHIVTILLLLTLVFSVGVKGDKNFEVDLDISTGLHNFFNGVLRKVSRFSHWSSPKVRNFISSIQPTHDNDNHGPPQSPLHQHASFSAPSYSGWGWNYAQRNPGWGWKPQIHQPEFNNWGWNNPLNEQEAWGWSSPTSFTTTTPKPKNCFLKPEPPFTLGRRTDVPPDSEVLRAIDFRRGQRISENSSVDELPEFTQPQPPGSIGVGHRPSLPIGYYTAMTNDIEISVLDASRGMYNVTKDDTRLGGTSSDMSVQDNSFMIATMVIQSPQVSAPINGSLNPFFQTGLKERDSRFGNEEQVHPFQNQLNDLMQLWNEVEKEEVRHRSNNLLSDAPPLLVSMVQRFTISEPPSAEKSILDSAFNFGVQANRIKFDDMNVVISSWLKGRREQRNPFQQREEGNVNATDMNQFNSWIRSHMRVFRATTLKPFDAGENLASLMFQQSQYFIKPPGDDGCPREVDPHSKIAAGSLMAGIGSVGLRGPSICPPQFEEC